MARCIRYAHTEHTRSLEVFMRPTKDLYKGSRPNKVWCKLAQNMSKMHKAHQAQCIEGGSATVPCQPIISYQALQIP